MKILGGGITGSSEENEDDTEAGSREEIENEDIAEENEDVVSADISTRSAESEEPAVKESEIREYLVEEDAFVRSDRATTNYSSDPFSQDHGQEYVGGNYRALTMKNASGSQMMSLMKFTLPTADELKEYDKFEFIFHVLRNPNNNQGDQTFRFCYTTETDWNESQITWNNKPQAIVPGGGDVLFDFQIPSGTDYQSMIKSNPTAGDITVDITDKIKELAESGIEKITVFTYGMNVHNTFLQISERSCKNADSNTTNSDQAAKIVAINTKTPLGKLNALIAECEALSQKGYTQASFKQFADKLSEAKAFASANPTEETAIEAMYAELLNAKEKLAQEKEYAVTEDAYIRNGANAGTNYNFENITSAHGAQYADKNYRALSIKNNNGAEIMTAMKFPLPTKEEIEEGRFNEYEMVFHIFKNPDPNVGNQVYKFCYSTDVSWSETGIKWNNKPSDMVRGSRNVLFDFEIKQGTEYEKMDDSAKEIHMDITDTIQKLVDEGVPAITVFAYAENPLNTSLMLHERSSSLAAPGANSDKAARLVARESAYTLAMLTELIAECKTLSASDYSKDSFARLKTELAAAENFAAGNPTDENDAAAIRTRYKALKAAKDGLTALLDPNDPANIAYLRPTRSNLNTSDTDKVTDGDNTTYWQGKFYPAYVDVDLMDTYDISEIILNFPTDKAVYYTLYGSNDGKNYKEIAKKHSDAKKTKADTFTLTNCSYRIVRVYIEYADSGLASSLNEIRVHGTRTNTNTEELRTGTFEEITGIKDYRETDYAKPITEAETIENVYGVVDRTVGASYRSWFEFQLAPNTENDSDYFELSDHNGKILIKGNEGVSLTSGLNYYYKNYVNVQISEQTMQNEMPANLVPIGGTVRKETPMKVRYAYNYCTLSYTFAFFGEEEWQRENDWLALNGVNVVLDLAGQEAAWIKFLMNYHYSYDEAKDWLVGPGYYAWQYMDNMEQFGGPIPDGYVIDRVELARSTQRWKNSLGMQTVLQGYAGMVPVNFTEYNPGAAVVKQGDWNGFARPAMLATDSAAYDEMAASFYAAQEFVYGTASDYYAVDPFHEGGTRPSGLTDNTIAKEVLDSMLRYDADAVWVVQAWQSNPTSGLLDGMGANRNQHCLIVDLIKYPINSNLAYAGSEFRNTNWVWCLLGNFGGNPTMNGQLKVMTDTIQKAKKERNYMVGLGMISEATYDNPMIYDLLFDLAWADDSFDLDRWMDSYIERRYGGITERAKLAWDYIKDSNYAQGVRLTNELFGLRTGGLPEEIGKKSIGYDTEKLENALRLLLEDFDKFKSSEAYLYDITEIMRQVVSNYTVMKNNELIDAKNAKDLNRFIALKAEFLNAFDVLNEVAGTQKEQLGGEWIGKAQDRAREYDDFSKSVFTMNAKSLITTWGSTAGSLVDYAFRTYEGVFTDLIKTNWEDYLNQVEANLKNGTPVAKKGKTGYIHKYWKWVVGEQNYTRDARDSAEEVRSVANKVLEQCTFTGALDPNVGNLALGKSVAASGTGTGKAAFVTDGKEDRIFTITGGKDGRPEIVIDLLGYFDISKMQLLLDKAENLAYEIYVSADGETWELFDEKAAGSGKEVFEGAGKTGRYVKVMGKDESELAFKEVRVYGNQALPDLEQLGALIKAAEELDVSGNPQDKISRFKKALETAKKAYESQAAPDTVNTVYWELYNAMADLNLSGVYNIALKKPVTAHNDPDGNSGNLVDGNLETAWNSGRLSTTGKPYEDKITEGWSIVDLQGLYSISEVQLAFAKTDIWYQYEIYSSLDGKTWTKLGEKKTQNLPNEKEDTYVVADPYARYVKLQTTNIKVGSDGKRSPYEVKELQVFGKAVALDKTGLKEQIDRANGLEKADYTAGSWKAVADALIKAKKVYEMDETKLLPEDISKAEDALKKALDALKPISDSVNLIEKMKELSGVKDLEYANTSGVGSGSYTAAKDEDENVSFKSAKVISETEVQYYFASDKKPHIPQILVLGTCCSMHGQTETLALTALNKLAEYGDVTYSFASYPGDWEGGKYSLSNSSYGEQASVSGRLEKDDSLESLDGWIEAGQRHITKTSDVNAWTTLIQEGAADSKEKTWDYIVVVADGVQAKDMHVNKSKEGYPWNGITIDSTYNDESGNVRKGPDYRSYMYGIGTALKSMQAAILDSKAKIIVLTENVGLENLSKEGSTYPLCAYHGAESGVQNVDLSLGYVCLADLQGETNITATNGTEGTLVSNLDRLADLKEGESYVHVKKSDGSAINWEDHNEVWTYDIVPKNILHAEKVINYADSDEIEVGITEAIEKADLLNDTFSKASLPGDKDIEELQMFYYDGSEWVEAVRDIDYKVLFDKEKENLRVVGLKDFNSIPYYITVKAQLTKAAIDGELSQNGSSLPAGTAVGQIAANSDCKINGDGIKTPHILLAGDLSVEKLVSGDGADAEKKFDFHVSASLKDEALNGTYGEMKFENGEAAFSLSSKERKTAAGLPAGTQYTVAEDAEKGYETTYSENSQGNIQGWGKHTVQVTNQYSAEPEKPEPEKPEPKPEPKPEKPTPPDSPSNSTKPKAPLNQVGAAASTGDGAEGEFWLVIMGASGLALLLALVISGRRKKEHSNK